MVALLTTGIVLLTFTFATLINEPVSIAALVGILLVSLALDVGWARIRRGRTTELTDASPLSASIEASM